MLIAHLQLLLSNESLESTLYGGLFRFVSNHGDSSEATVDKSAAKMESLYTYFWTTALFCRCLQKFQLIHQRHSLLVDIPGS